MIEEIEQAAKEKLAKFDAARNEINAVIELLQKTNVAATGVEVRKRVPFTWYVGRCEYKGFLDYGKAFGTFTSLGYCFQVQRNAYPTVALVQAPGNIQVAAAKVLDKVLEEILGALKS